MLTPSPQAVHLWVLRDDAAREPELPSACVGLLSPEESARLARISMPRVRREYLLGRALLRTTLSRYAAGVAPSAWRFAEGPHGKPDLAGPPGAPPLRFNLSHTTGLLALAVTLGRDVGVDVEHTGRDVSDDRVAERFFAPPEAADVLARLGEARRERFFAYWTLKEVYIKARGMGLAIPLSSFWLDVDREPIRIAFAPELADDPLSWQLARLRLSAEHAIAVAVRRGTGPDVGLVVRALASVGDLFRP